MDPVEQLRLLRDDSRWIEEELDFDAYAAPARRRWRWPRIAGFSAAGVAVAAAAALVIAGVHGSWNAAPVPAGPSPSVSASLPGIVPACQRDQFSFGFTQYEPAQKWDRLVRAGWITGLNTSNTTCQIDQRDLPTVSLAQDADTEVGSGAAVAELTGSAILEIRPGESFSAPFALYTYGGVDAACAMMAKGLELAMFSGGSPVFVAAETTYCGSDIGSASWSIEEQANGDDLGKWIAELAANPPAAPTPPANVTGPQCTTDELSAALAPDRSSDQGTDWAIIEVTNSGDRSCEIGPVASLSWVASSGGPGLGVPASTGQSENDPAVIAPGESAGVIIGFRDAGSKREASCDPLERDWLRLSLGTDVEALSGVVDVDVSALRMHACAFADGASQLTVFGPMVGASLHD
jgi:hypothetical protein